MLDWVLNTSLSITLNSVKKRNLETCNRQPITSLRPRWSNGMFRGRSGDVRQGGLRDVLGTNILPLGKDYKSLGVVNLKEITN